MSSSVSSGLLSGDVLTLPPGLGLLACGDGALSPEKNSLVLAQFIGNCQSFTPTDMYMFAT